MSLLLEKSVKDMNVVKVMQELNDEMYLDVCCYHAQQAIEKILKYSIELKGVAYPFTHSIDALYQTYVDVGWEEFDTLELMAGTLTTWESSSRYKDSFYATIKQLEIAKNIYFELHHRVIQSLGDSEMIDIKNTHRVTAFDDGGDNSYDKYKRH